MTVASRGALLWEPSEQRKAASAMTRYLDWLAERRGRRFEGYQELWEWSVADLDGFWSSIWDFTDTIAHASYTAVLADRAMPGARWFPGATLNYAEHALRRRDDHPAIIARSEARPEHVISYAELHELVGAAIRGLRNLGVGRGDRVAAYLPNAPETLIAFLATAAVGAVWSSCSPEFGIGSVISRFSQIEPTVLLAIDGYRYGGADHDRTEQVAEIRRRLPTLDATVVVPYLDAGRVPGGGYTTWEEVIAQRGAPVYEAVPFDHPLWVLYSSGTTGPPKGIVHGHGGIVLELQKVLALHSDIGPDDRMFWFTTTGWMMWNYLISTLLVGGTVVMYDGSPAFPSLDALWSLAEQTGLTYFGTSAPFLQACMKAGIEPGRDHDLSAIRSLGSTGAPLPPEGFEWVYRHVRDDLLLGSVSGGTDLCTAFVTSCPLLPVRAGELQCRALGAKVESYDEAGRPVIGETGELVITEPMPSMPVYLWGDEDGERYRDTYFSDYPGVWRHGDWIEITPDGGAVIYGRSDSTLNRGGVRMGTSEFYRVVEEFPDVADSVVVDTGRLGQEGRLLLFLVLKEGEELTAALQREIKQRLREELSPRHVPDEIMVIPAVPRTLSGKKLEVPIKKILAGVAVEDAARVDALANPESLDVFRDLAG